MNSTVDVILVNRCNQNDEFRTVLSAKMCVRVLLILMLAAAAVLVVGAGVGAAATWYVDDDGGAEIDYMKIQDAVNAAEDGDTIYVYAGIYNECLIVCKSLILQGENREATIVDANGGNKGIEITANDCAISGFTIRNCLDTGIDISSSSNSNTITDNIIHSVTGGSNCDWDGIEVTISSYNVISNNKIFDCDDEGIELDGSSYNIVINNTIYSNTEVGIDVRGSLHNYIANNTIYSNGEPGISLGRSWSTEPVVWGSSHNTITFNVIYSNGDDGIGLKNSSNNNITNNNISNNQCGGIHLRNSSNNNITKNNISLNNDTGIDIAGSSSHNFITNNNVFDNYDEGVELELDGSHSYNYVTGNNIFNNSDDGIDLGAYSSYNFITDNNIFDNHDDGVDLDAYCSHNSITDNNIFDNHNDGVDITSSSNNALVGNTVSSNGDNGIQIKLSNNNRIYHNNFLNNADQADDNGNNFWDNGYPSGGNYWSDHTCTDNPSDGSQPYTIDGGAGAVDHYPFESMNGWLTTPQKGDLDDDGILTPADAAIALAIAASGAQNPAADVSGDGSVTSLDALMILQAAENTHASGTEIAYGDGSAEGGWSMGHGDGTCSDDGGNWGYAIRMTTPDSEPFTITAIKLFSRRYGEDCNTRFEIWGQDRNTLYSDIVSHSEYSAAVDSFDSVTWGYKEVPDVVVSGDFYIAMYTDSSDPSDEIYPDTGVYVGYDTSFSSDRSYTTQGKTLTWDLSTPQETTNWMIRAVGMK
ncbi:MAG: hypothetical protein GQ567_02600 [Methanosarcinales archaeon]|nr:hypothetical protein [Methanosarcinales archaeon]